MKRALFLVLFALSLVGCEDKIDFGVLWIHVSEDLKTWGGEAWIKNSSDNSTVKYLKFSRYREIIVEYLPPGQYYIEYQKDYISHFDKGYGKRRTDVFTIRLGEWTDVYIQKEQD